MPPDVMQAIAFIYVQGKSRDGVTWADIAAFMGWDCPRDHLRPKMKRLRRWGVRWDINKQGSTRVEKRVHPYIEAELAKLKKSA